ncbi:MAG: hypothetical protein HPKKFMNG_02676 [Planctomycetes bacterium]|nr:hypothetical protein [Planctomycetota bacterium]
MDEAKQNNLNMNWTLKTWVCGALCALVLSACVNDAQAQVTLGADAPPAQERPPSVELQAEGDPFVEQVKALNAASDKDARRKAIDAVLVRAAELKVDPLPLVEVLKNRKPEAVHTELVAYLRESAPVRHVAFLPLLVVAANDPVDAVSKPAREVLGAYDAEGVIAAMQAMLKGDDALLALAAAGFARQGIGGVAGRAKLVAPLVAALESKSSDLRATAARALRDITLLDLGDDAALWREYLGQKSEETLVEEIANRLDAALRKSEAERKELEEKLVAVTLEQMNAQKGSVSALLKHLKTSEFQRVRLRAAELLGELLAKLATDEEARPAVEELGALLLDSARSEALRVACAKALSARPAMGFEYVDKALEANGLTPALRLELVRALKGSRAALRLAALFQAEILLLDSAGNTLLHELIQQAQNVFEPQTSPEARTAVLAAFTNLLRAVEAKFRQELSVSERDRFASLAQQASVSLTAVARVRAADTSDCVEALLDVAQAISLRAPAASSSALTAVRESLGVLAAREQLIKRLSADPLVGKLRALYDQLSQDSNGQGLLITLLSVYTELGSAPEEVLAALRKDLLERAGASADTTTTPPDAPATTQRAAARRLLARAARSLDEQVALIQELLAQPYSDNDVLDVLRFLPAPRGTLLVKSLQPRIELEPERVGRLTRAIEPLLSSATRESAEYKTYFQSLRAAVTALYARRIDAALGAAPSDKQREDLRGCAQGVLSDMFVCAAVEQLLATPATSEGRDFVALILVEKLKASHPGRYDNVTLAGAADVFKKTLEDLKPRLKEDGYPIS